MPASLAPKTSAQAFALLGFLFTVSLSSNHVSFFYAQLSALQVLIKDEEGARQSLRLYFNGKFQEQIVQNGEQVWISEKLLT